MRPYRPRSITFLGHASRDGVTLKTYGITMTGGPPQSGAVDAARSCAFSHLRTRRPPHLVAGVDWTGLPTHGAGSLIVHEGREAVFAVLDVWVDENMLRHHVWAASRTGPTRFESLASSDVAMCVWELAVIQHERQAWLRHVLTASGHGDLQAYLDDVLIEDTLSHERPEATDG